MGVGSLAAFCRELIRRGMDAATPAALIQQGTTPRQRVFTGDLTTLPSLIEKEEIRPPSMVIVGEVVKLHEKLAWYEPAAVDGQTH